MIYFAYCLFEMGHLVYQSLIRRHEKLQRCARIRSSSRSCHVFHWKICCFLFPLSAQNTERAATPLLTPPPPTPVSKLLALSCTTIKYTNIFFPNFPLSLRIFFFVLVFLSSFDQNPSFLQTLTKSTSLHKVEPISKKLWSDINLVNMRCR